MTAKVEDEGERDRGRDAAAPTQIPPKGWKDILLRTKDEVLKDHAMLIAAGVAFYGLLAAFPAIGAFIALWSLFSSPADIVKDVAPLRAVLPAEAAKILTDQAEAVAANPDAAKGFGALFGIVFSLWSASSGTKSLIEGVNIAYGEADKRGFVKSTLIALGLTFLVVAGLLVAVVTIAGLPILLDRIALGAATETALALAPWPILFVGGLFMLALVYRVAPARNPAQWRWLSWGAALAMALWSLGSIGFSIYVANFANYGATYGALGGVAALLLWLWLSALAVLIGAEFNAEMERQTRQDSTEGAPAPMGQRNANAADTLGESKGRSQSAPSRRRS